MKKNICIIGAGNIGSRHLQSLKKVIIPLSIQVIDPYPSSLTNAKESYENIEPKKTNHKIRFLEDITDAEKNIDLAIIATSSNVRRKIMEQLFSTSTVKFLVLEKLLFQNYQDYNDMEQLLKRNKTKAWVNCNMRSMPFYKNIKNKLNNKPVEYFVNGGRFGLITNSIHYIDHIAFLTGCLDFTIDTKNIDKKPVKSKRKGFLELNGTLNISFKDGSFASMTCYPKGNAPIIVQIYSEDYRLISKETEGKAWETSPKSDWKWTEIEADIIYQSNLTNTLTQNILKKGDCELPSFHDSAKLHLNLLEELKNFLNKNSKTKYLNYPFT